LVVTWAILRRPCFNPDMRKGGWLFLGLLALAGAEACLPLRSRRRARAGRGAVNAAVAALAGITSSALVAPLVKAARVDRGWLQRLGLPAPVEAVATLALLDASYYGWHRLNHASALLWRFHRAHHADPDLDVTTALRFHPAEVGLSAIFRTLQTLVIQPREEIAAIYDLMFRGATLFHHSNLRLPERLDDTLALAIVTPRFHGIHHSEQAAQAGSRFSVLCSVWDRIFGTLSPDVPPATVVIGAPGDSPAEANAIRDVLLDPFS